MCDWAELGRVSGWLCDQERRGHRGGREDHRTDGKVETVVGGRHNGAEHGDWRALKDVRQGLEGMYVGERKGTEAWSGGLGTPVSTGMYSIYRVIRGEGRKRTVTEGQALQRGHKARYGVYIVGMEWEMDGRGKVGGGWSSGASQQKLKYDSKNCPATRDTDERTAANRSPTALITPPSMLGGSQEAGQSYKFYVIFVL